MALTVARASWHTGLPANSKRVSWGAAIAIGFCSSGIARAEQAYYVQNLNVPVQYYSPRYYAINDHGDVCGATANGTADVAYHVSNGQLTMLGTLGGPTSWARSINNLGQVVGTAYLPGGSRSHAFLWNGGSLIDLGTLGPVDPYVFESQGLDINDAGQVVGATLVAVGAGQEQHAFLLTPDNGVWFRDDDANGKNDLMLDLGAFGGWRSEAVAIDNAGRIVGKYWTAAGDVRAFLWRNGQMLDLGTLGGTSSWAVDINNLGQVLVRTGMEAQPPVGVLTLITPDGDVWNRDLDLDGANDLMTVIQTAFTNPYPFALNDSGQVVGFDAGGVFVWEAGNTRYVDDYSLTDPDWYAYTCYDVNSAGALVCDAVRTNPPGSETQVVVIGPANPETEGIGSRFLEARVPPGSASASLSVITADGTCALGFVDPFSAPYPRLGDSPVAIPCDSWGTVNVSGEEIAPGVQYRLRLEFGGGVVGTSDVVAPWKWGDAVAPFGVVNFQDVAAVVQCFQGSGTAPPVTACDLVPAVPNGIVNFQDISACVGAFQGKPYPFSTPEPCP